VRSALFGILRYVKSQNGKDLIYIVAEGRNHVISRDIFPYAFKYVKG